MKKIKKFLKEMPKSDQYINCFCVVMSSLVAGLSAAIFRDCGVRVSLCVVIALAIVAFCCGIQLCLEWTLFKSSLDGSPRRSTSDYCVTGLTGR